MSSIPGSSLLRPIAQSLKFRSDFALRARFLSVVPSVLLLALLATLCGAGPTSAQGFIFVTSLTDKINGVGGCSLQEAIYSANFDANIAVSSYDANGLPNFVTTNCLPGNGKPTGLSCPRKELLPSPPLWTTSKVSLAQRQLLALGQ